MSSNSIVLIKLGAKLKKLNFFSNVKGKKEDLNSYFLMFIIFCISISISLLAISKYKLLKLNYIPKSIKIN